MTIFTTVPDSVLEPGDPIRSVDIIAIKDNTNFLNELTQIDIQTFNSSGTWTKPTLNGTVVGRFARIQVWGGGGGAGRGANGGAGGGGGGYNEVTLPLSSLGSTETVTIGAGGAGRTGSAGNGTTGGTSSFGSHCSAFGGGAGIGTNTIFSGSGGGGPFGAGGIGSTTLGTFGAPGAPASLYNGDSILTAQGAGGSNQDGELRTNGVSGFFHGGGSGATSARSAGSVWGGGAGATFGSNFPGASIYGGNGGGHGAAGTQPGGGGGASSATNANGANGAAGRVIVTTF